jgi:hypothetical protein
VAVAFSAVLIECSTDLESVSWRELVSRIRKSVPIDHGVIFEQVSRPTLINRYRRSYYLSFDRSIRLPIDEKICSWMQFVGRRPNLRYARPFRGHVVLEFKAPHERAQQLADTVASIEGRISKYSKYVAGMVGLLQMDHRW